jgi:acetyltransferase-like isoleucine patch superfamily enzyme
MIRIVISRLIKGIGRRLWKLKTYIKLADASGWSYVSSNGNFTVIDASKLLIKGRVFINDYCYINAMGGIELGEDVVISAGAKLISSSLDLQAGRRALTQHLTKPITIGNNVWIGAGAIILPGVNIGSNSVIAAGAVVTRPVPKNAVFAGIPACKIRDIQIVR